MRLAPWSRGRGLGRGRGAPAADGGPIETPHPTMDVKSASMGARRRRPIACVHVATALPCSAAALRRGILRPVRHPIRVAERDVDRVPGMPMTRRRVPDAPRGSVAIPAARRLPWRISSGRVCRHRTATSYDTGARFSLQILRAEIGAGVVYSDVRSLWDATSGVPRARALDPTLLNCTIWRCIAPTTLQPCGLPGSVGRRGLGRLSPTDQRSDSGRRVGDGLVDG